MPTDLDKLVEETIDRIGDDCFLWDEERGEPIITDDTGWPKMKACLRAAFAKVETHRVLTR